MKTIEELLGEFRPILEQETYLPIEFFHWVGMTDEFLYMVEDILSKHPEFIRAKNNGSDSALIIAARTNNNEICKFLLKNENTDVNYINNERKNAFSIVILNKNMSLIDSFLNTPGINLNALVLNSKNLLQLAAYTGNDILFEKLYDFGVDINHIDDDGEHCLFDLLSTYSNHKNYFLFEFILEKMPYEMLWRKNKQNMDIIDFVINDIKTTETNTHREFKKNTLTSILKLLDFHRNNPPTT